MIAEHPLLCSGDVLVNEKGSGRPAGGLGSQLVHGSELGGARREVHGVTHEGSMRCV